MSPETPIPDISPIERLFSRPSWADPEFTLTVNEFSPEVITIGAGQTVRLAVNDPKRWILLFSKKNPSTAPVQFAPLGIPVLMGIEMGVIGTLLRLSLFDYGPIVSYEWYGTSAALVDIAVWSIQIGPKG